MRRLPTGIEKRHPGQVLILFVLGATAMVAMLGLVVDGGNVYINRRVARTAADTAALAAVRALAVKPPSGTNVVQKQEVGNAICTYVPTNNFGTYTGVLGAKYVGSNGQPVGGTDDVFKTGMGC